jgi:DNA-binding IclR family transcriptional regulator
VARSSPGVGRVVAVLNFFADHPGQAYTLTDLVRALKLSRATCHALLGGLVEAGYLYRTNDKSYVIGPALISIGRIASANSSPYQVAQPELRALADEFDVTCAIVSHEGDDAVVRDRAVSISQLGATVQLGARLRVRPPFGAAFYAWRPLIEVQAWLDELKPSPTAEQRAATYSGVAFAQANNYVCFVRTAELDQRSAEEIFNKGSGEISVSVETQLLNDRVYELSSLVAPVFGADGKLEFTLTLLGFLSASTGAEIKRIARRLCEVCSRLTEYNGARLTEARAVPEPSLR